jgi:hypothetical protein
MTSLGKLLVFVNLAFCVFLAAFSLAIYTNRVEWASADMKTGEVIRLKQEVATVNAGYPAAAAKWLKTREEVLVRETGKTAAGEKSKQFAGRSADRLWYEQQMRELRFLANKQGNRPAYMTVFDDMTGQAKLDANNFSRPLLTAALDRDGKTQLWSLDWYNKEDRKVIEELEQKMLAMLDHIKADIEATERMNGPKGLKQRLEDERVKGLQVAAEQELISPQILDVIARSGATKQRTEDLKKRIDELNRALAAEDDK